MMKYLRYVVAITILMWASVFSSFSIAAEWLYSVRPGDTFWQICREYTHKSNCWQELPDLNNVKRTRQLPPGYIVRVPIAWLKTPPNAVTITYVAGEPMVKRSDNSAFSVAVEGDKLPIGSTISSGEGHINLLFADGSTVQMEPGSILQLDAFSSFGGEGIVDSQMRLNKGAVKARVVKREPATRFQITTPAAVAAVRGTEYRVTSIEGETPEMRSEVFEGLVDVSLADTVKPVPAGFGITAKVGEALSEPRALLEAPIINTDDNVQMLPVTVSWAALKEAKRYQFELLNDNANEERLQSTIVQENSISLTDVASGCYQVSVRGIDVFDLHGKMGKQKICVAPFIATPQLTSNLLSSKKSTGMLQWDAIASAAHYRIQLAADPEFSTIIVDETTINSTYSWSSNAVVYIRVMAVGEQEQNTSYSNVLTWAPEARRSWDFAFFISVVLAGLLL